MQPWSKQTPCQLNILGSKKTFFLGSCPEGKIILTKNPLLCQKNATKVFSQWKLYVLVGDKEFGVFNSVNLLMCICLRTMYIVFAKRLEIIWASRSREKCCYATCRLDTYEFNAQDHSCPQIPSSVLVTCLNKEWCLQPRFQERDYGVCQAETSG